MVLPGLIAIIVRPGGEQYMGVIYVLMGAVLVGIGLGAELERDGEEKLTELTRLFRERQDRKTQRERHEEAGDEDKADRCEREFNYLTVRIQEQKSKLD